MTRVATKRYASPFNDGKRANVESESSDDNSQADKGKDIDSKTDNRARREVGPASIYCKAFGDINSIPGV